MMKEVRSWKQAMENFRLMRSKGWTARYDELRKHWIRFESPDCNDYFCPVTALVYAKTGHFYPTGSYVIAAQQHGIPNKVRDLLSDAAESQSRRYLKWRRELAAIFALKVA